jgi:hypothetical protein
MKIINSEVMVLMNHKDFFKFIFVGIAVLTMGALIACGNSNSPDCMTDGTVVFIQDNHGHILSITIADINAGVNKTYTTTGTKDHTHDITITAADFTSLMNNTGIQETSSESSGVLYPIPHTHIISVGCGKSSGSNGYY